MTQRGTLLLHPIVLICLGLLIINDRFLKDTLPGWWTGKLSDIAGLVVLPVLILTIVELVGPSHRRPDMRSLLAVGAGVAGAFALMKLGPGERIYEVGLGTIRWTAAVPFRWLRGDASGRPGEVAMVRDRSDLLALPAAFVGACLLLVRRHRPDPRSAVEDRSRPAKRRRTP